MAERYDQRSSDEIRRDIQGTRVELRETVDALERKLSIGQIVDEVWGRVGSRRAAGAAASNVGDTIRDHPVPLALMGLGVAWLAIDRATGFETSTRVGQGTYERAEGRVGPYRGSAVHESSGSSSIERAKRKAADAVDTVRSKASAMADKAGEMASDITESVGSSGDREPGNGESHGWRHGDDGPGMADRAGEVAERARETADRAKERAAHGARKARQGLASAMDDQPLAFGAVAFGLGLASGLAAPATRWEDRTMGQAADTMKEEAATVTRDAARDVREAAEGVVSAAKETTREEMRDRDLDLEGMKGRTRTSRDRTEERMSD